MDYEEARNDSVVIVINFEYKTFAGECGVEERRIMTVESNEGSV